MTELLALTAVMIIAGVAVYLINPGLVYRLSMRLERRFAGLKTRRVALPDNIEVVFNDGGNGEPIVLLHGFTADKDHWNRVARYLTPANRVIAPDLPGFGESTQDSALAYNVEVQLQRLEAFVDALGLQRFHLGGSSMGGALAGHFAARHRDRVLSLWLLAPAGVLGDQVSEMTQLLLADDKHPLIPGSRAEFESTLDFVFAIRPFLPAALRRHLTRVAQSRQALYTQIFAELIDDDAQQFQSPLNTAVAGLEIPTLVVWGEADRVLHPSGAQILDGLLAKAQVVMMPGVGHLPMIEAVADCARDYRNFLVNVSSSDAASAPDSVA